MSKVYLDSEHQIQNEDLRDRYPFVTSVRTDSLEGFKKYNKNKQKKNIHLQSYMAEFIEEPTFKDVEQIKELDPYQKILQIAESYKLNTNHKQKYYFKHPTSPKTNNFTHSNIDSIETKINNQVQSYKDIVFNSNPTSKTKQKSKLIKEIKQKSSKCLLNYIKDNEKKKIFQYVDQLIQQYRTKIITITNQSQASILELNKEKENLKRKSLEQDIEIQRLKFYIEQLKVKLQKCQGDFVNFKKQTKELEKFQKDYYLLKQQFPQMTCAQVVKEYHRLQQACLNKLIELNGQQKQKYQFEIQQLKKNIIVYQTQVSSLKDKLGQLFKQCQEQKMFKGIQNLQIQELKKSKDQLKNIHNKIFSVFNVWHDNKTNTQKQIMKEIGFFPKQYTYSDMLDYMVFFKNELSTEAKVGQYLRKILGSIQGARRKLFPSQVNQKLDPQKVIDLLAKNYEILKSKLKTYSSTSDLKLSEKNPISTDQKYFK